MPGLRDRAERRHGAPAPQSSLYRAIGPRGSPRPLTVRRRGAAFLPLPGDATLLFYIEVRGGDFAVVTDLTGISGHAAPVFTDAGAGTDGELGLAPADPARPRLPPGIFAAVEIRPGRRRGPPLPGQLPGQAGAMGLLLRHRPGAGRGEPHRGGRLARRAEGALRFSAATSIRRTRQRRRSPVGIPAMRCVHFVSDEPVAAREEPRKSAGARLRPRPRSGSSGSIHRCRALQRRICRFRSSSIERSSAQTPEIEERCLPIRRPGVYVEEVSTSAALGGGGLHRGPRLHRIYREEAIYREGPIESPSEHAARVRAALRQGPSLASFTVTVDAESQVTGVTRASLPGSCCTTP